uniref:Uncharacterized protein n=1 Tax=Romanomermis culicivorax TaxID=13658 RepID=A0A915JLB8_ROMCU
MADRLRKKLRRKFELFSENSTEYILITIRTAGDRTDCRRQDQHEEKTEDQFTLAKKVDKETYSALQKSG